MTNGDKVRQMTDEQIADVLSWNYICPSNIECPGGGKPLTPTNCRACWMEWLKQEAKGESK